MGIIAAEKERLMKYREDVRLKEEQHQDAKLLSMRSDVMELWDALSTTHPKGIHLTERDIDATVPTLLRDFLFNETGKQRGTDYLKYVVYPMQDGDIPMVVLGMVDEHFVFNSEDYFIAGFVLSVRDKEFSLETHTQRAAHRTTQSKSEVIMSDMKNRGLLVRYGTGLLVLAQQAYKNAVDSEAGPVGANGLTNG